MRKENGRSMVVGERKRKRGRAYESILNILLVDELENLLIGKDEVTGEKAAFPSKRKEIKKEEKRKGGEGKGRYFQFSSLSRYLFQHFPSPLIFIDREYTRTTTSRTGGARCINIVGILGTRKPRI